MTRKHSKRLAVQASELAMAVPSVVAHRLARIALAGARPTPRDTREFHRMSSEKVVAFWQSWFAMGWAVVAATQRGWIAWLQGSRVPFIDAAQVVSRGLAPVHRRATANARRLAKTRLR